MISAAEICYSKGFPLRKACTFLFLFFAFYITGFGQDPSTEIPSFTHLDSRFLDGADADDTSGMVLAVDTDSDGNVYILTFGKGVFKYNYETGSYIKIINDQLGDPGQLNAPLDLAIDGNDVIHIADSGSKLIKKFDTSGASLGVIGVGAGGDGRDEFWQPTGLEFDRNDNLYIVDAYRGNNDAVTERYFLKIYFADGNFRSWQGTGSHPLNNPYRVAANNDYIFIGHAENNGETLVFNKQLEYIKTLDNIGSTGSIFIDNFDFVYVVDYADRIELNQVFELVNGNLGFWEIFALYNEINAGIAAGDFKIQVYNSSLNWVKTINDAPMNLKPDDIQFPVDITLDDCDKMYLDDGELDGFAINFNLEIYERSPSNDIISPSAQCVGDFDLQLVNGSASITVNDINNGSTDNCGIANISLSKTSFTDADIGSNTVTMTVTDNAGNQDSCPVLVTIVGEEVTNGPPEFENCPVNITADNNEGECGAVVTFETPGVTDDGGSITPTRTDGSGLNSGDVFPIGVTTITFQADDGVNEPVECSFTITVNDTQDPTITCPSNIQETVPFGEDGKIVTYSEPTFDDNCPGASIEQTEGLPSGSEFPLGDTVNTFVVTDAAGGTSECSFTVTITESEDTEDPVINCSENITQANNSGECGASIAFSDPTATDNSGNVTITRTDVTGLSSGDLFPVGTTTLSFRAEDEAGNIAECSFTVTVSDAEVPTITCPSNIQETVPFGEDRKIVTYSAPTFEDNCPDASIQQTEGLPSGSEFPLGDTVNTFVVTDTAGSTAQCSFTVTITESEDTEDPVITCPAPISRNNDDGLCGAVVTFDDPVASDNSGNVSVERTDSGPASGQLFPVGVTTVSFRATDNSGNSVECSFNVTIADNELPQVKCVSNYSIAIGQDETRTINASALDDGSTDNCEITNLSLSKDTFTAEDEGVVLVSLTATDAVGNSSNCEVNVEVIVTQETTLSLICPADYEVFADENCQYFVPDFSEIVQVSPPGATIEQSMEPGSTIITNADPFITITATYEDQVESCDIYLLLKDEIDPSINCIADQTVTINEGETYTLPDYRSQLQVSDNCENYQVVQDPAAGTEITQDTEVAFTVTDQAGNMDTCSFQLNLITEGALAIGCPPDKIVSHEACPYSVPDYTDEAEVVNGDGAEVTQNPSPGSVINGSEYEVTLRVEKNGEFAECSFLVTVVDDTAPEAICVENYEISLNEGETVTLAPSQIDDGSTDSCSGVNLSLDKTEFTSADEGANTVTLTVTDEAGNVSSCEATVQVTVTNIDVNQPPVAYDEEYTTEINTSLNVPASNGVLVNDTDPENDELTAVLDTDVENGTLQLNADGSFTYTPDTDFVGQDFFTYKANDGEYDSNTIFVSINVVDSSGEFSCSSQVVLGLGPEGEAILDINLLYTGNSEDIEFSADQLLFDCDDIGENTVTLTYTGRLDGTCEIPVMVVDDAPPVLQLRDISIDLNLQGVATISFEDINNGSYDECDVDVTYTLSKMVFSCKDLGENIIQVTAEDESGNTATASAIVRVFAEKEICTDPLPGPEYIFIYPNPNSGSFKVATPGDVTIQRIEVFDKRGRFITARNYATTDTEYAMHLVPLQEAVYILKLVTNEGIYIKRMIFKR